MDKLEMWFSSRIISEKPLMILDGSNLSHALMAIVLNGADGICLRQPPKARFGKDFKSNSPFLIESSSALTIVHQLLLTDRYSVVFESEEAFKPQFEVALEQGNLPNAGKVTFELNNTTKKITIMVNDSKEYLIDLKDIDWNDV